MQAIEQSNSPKDSHTDKNDKNVDTHDNIPDDDNTLDCESTSEFASTQDYESTVDFVSSRDHDSIFDFISSLDSRSTGESYPQVFHSTYRSNKSGMQCLIWSGSNCLQLTFTHKQVAWSIAFIGHMSAYITTTQAATTRLHLIQRMPLHRLWDWRDPSR